MYLLFQGYNDSRYSIRNTESKGNGNWLSHINILIQLNFIFASLYFAYGHKTKVLSLQVCDSYNGKWPYFRQKAQQQLLPLTLFLFVILYSSCPTIINPYIL